ncbi:acetyl-CoA acetyltransferase [Polymorphobacter multimanifer]|uniref:propanoyl-CoA C-acyltransferase n=1 Tax=Polymorphobacter multimanifer TaxID=1070431 RepID=A0A841LBC6_9SPHN|nr:acetyl-CoA acetyltransferase [Polymorphobacter multimanifer]
MAREAYMGVLADAGLANGNDIGMAWFGNCGMWTDGQGSIRGQVCLTPLVREGLFPERVPVINVEGGCATASIALHGAWKDVLSGQTDLSLAMGVEKTFSLGAPEKTVQLFDGGIDQYDREEWLSYYAAAGVAAGKPFAPGPGRTIFMDTYAMQAAWHMRTYGTTERQIAMACAKNHQAAVHNPKAQYRFAMTADEVLVDRPVSWPLTRAMCAPIGDGAAAALVCSGAWLARQPEAVRGRAVRIAASTMTAGKYRRLDEPGLSKLAAERAYRAADLTAKDIDVAEVHDATSFCEIYQSEMLGFCGIGEGGRLAESGETAHGGAIPINLSGGLVSKGHPVGATGLSMIDELVLQLRGEAGARQVLGARTALAENGGGVMGFDEAACSVIILQR